MANNVEKFLIEFVLKDKDALQGIKNFTNAYQTLQKKVQTSANTTQRATRASAQALQMDRRRAEASKKLNAIYSKRIALEARVQSGVGAMKRSANFEAVARADPRRASAIAGQLESAIRKGDIQAINNAKNALRRYGQEARRTQRSVLSLRTAQQGLGDSTRHMIRAYASLFTVLAATGSINKVGQGFEAMNSAMLAAMESKEEAAKQVEFLDKVTSRLGLSLLDTADQYTKFTFAAKGKLPTEDVNFFFQSMAEAGTVLGISNERMKLSFNAVQQMLNKTTVQSEELKRQ
jgi:hypothetical protein